MAGASDTNEHYRKLAFELGDGDRGRMLSGWQCDNPFAGDLLDAVRSRGADVDFRDYVYFDADEALTAAVRSLHLELDGLAPTGVLAGAGASPLISTFAAWLAEAGIRHAYFVPPLYHTLPTGLARYGIEVVPASERQPFETDFSLHLPDEKSILLLSDPVWYAGVAVPEEAVSEIVRWQQRTQSLVFVDGSLQYLSWNGSLVELTAALVPELTVRLVSPCKQLAVNGYRFAYLLLPTEHEPRLAWIYANLIGPASAESVVFAHAAIEAVRARNIPAAITNLASSRFADMVAAGRVTPGPVPDRGYYAFVRPSPALRLNGASMDGRYFDQPRYKGFIKVNLLSPAFPQLVA